MWGTLWIPVRRMHEAGSSGAWVTILGFLALAIVGNAAVLGQGAREITVEGKYDPESEVGTAWEIQGAFL